VRLSRRAFQREPFEAFEGLLAVARNSATPAAADSGPTSSAATAAALLAATALQLLTATASASQAEAMVAAGGASALLGVCALAERQRSKALLLQPLASLSRLAPLLLPQGAGSRGGDGAASAASGGAAALAECLSEVQQPRSSASLFDAAPPVPEVLYPNGAWVYDAREHDRLKVLYKLLRVLKMPRPRSNDAPGAAASSSSSSSADAQEDASAAKGGSGGGGKGLGGSGAEVPHAVALAEFVALQRAAVRGLAALATHPAARCLVVDHCLSELVALAVGLQPPNPAPSARPPQTVAAARNESVSESVSEGVSEGERALPLPGQLLVRSSSLVYMPPATPAAARAHLLLGEPELRAEALGCLVRLGFEGGARDLELCFNDAKVRPLALL
jgi:hypothetical protein